MTGVCLQARKVTRALNTTAVNVSKTQSAAQDIGESIVSINADLVAITDRLVVLFSENYLPAINIPE